MAKVEKYTPLLQERIDYLDHISKDLDPEDIEQWDNLRKDIEVQRTQPMPAADRVADRQDDRGPRYVDGRLEGIDEGMRQSILQRRW